MIEIGARQLRDRELRLAVAGPASLRLAGEADIDVMVTARSRGLLATASKSTRGSLLTAVLLAVLAIC